jgi:hypothetical protein
MSGPLPINRLGSRQSPIALPLNQDMFGVGLTRISHLPASDRQADNDVEPYLSETSNSISSPHQSDIVTEMASKCWESLSWSFNSISSCTEGSCHDDSSSPGEMPSQQL